MSKTKYTAILDEHEDSCNLDCGCRMYRPFLDSGEPAVVAIKFCPAHDAVGKAKPKFDLEDLALRLALDTYLATWSGKNPDTLWNKLQEGKLPKGVVIWAPFENKCVSELAEDIDSLAYHVRTLLEKVTVS